LAKNRGRTTANPGDRPARGDDKESPGAKTPGRTAYQIVLDRDTIVTLTQATALVPPRRRGRKTSVSTFFRSSTNGCRGLVLPTLQCGGTRCTSVEAIQWFFETLSELSRTHNAHVETERVPSLRSPSQRRRASEDAGKLLEQMGA
jgi:hypothetical protein